MKKLDPAVLAAAKAAAKKAAFTPRTWTPEEVITIAEFVKFCGGVTDLKYADMRSTATYEVTYDDTGEPFFKLHIPLTDGSVTEVKPSKRMREDSIDGDTFKVKNLRAILCTRGKEVTWTFDDINEMDDLLEELKNREK